MPALTCLVHFCLPFKPLFSSVLSFHALPRPTHACPDLSCPFLPALRAPSPGFGGSGIASPTFLLPAAMSGIGAQYASLFTCSVFLPVLPSCSVLSYLALRYPLLSLALSIPALPSKLVLTCSGTSVASVLLMAPELK